MGGKFGSFSGCKEPLALFYWKKAKSLKKLACLEERMKKIAKMFLCLALLGAALSFVMAPTNAQAAWGLYEVTITGAGYWSGYSESLEWQKQIYVSFTYDGNSWIRYSRGDIGDINQQLATALTALSNGGLAQMFFNNDSGYLETGTFSRIVAGE
jgi:hypothetical protein